MMSFGYSLVGLAVFAVMAPTMQLIARRAALSVPPVAILAIAAVVSHLVSVLLGAATLKQFQYWDAASVFGFGVMIYVFAFGAVYKSVSLELLLDLAQRPGRGVSLSDIIDRQVPDIFRRRTEILVAGGLANASDLPSWRPQQALSSRAGSQTFAAHSRLAILAFMSSPRRSRRRTKPGNCELFRPQVELTKKPRRYCLARPDDVEHLDDRPPSWSFRLRPHRITPIGTTRDVITRTEQESDDRRSGA